MYVYNRTGLLSKAYNFTYDGNGNITEKKTYEYDNGTIGSLLTTDRYNYPTPTDFPWHDQLKSYNDTVITYDLSGNPTNYLGKTMTWSGRLLKKADDTSMSYDINALRTTKGNRRYYWHNGNLIMERWMTGNTENYIYYYYDISGVFGFNYNGSEYYYQKNIFGDILAIYSSAGLLQCSYVYDAWGNHKIYDANGQAVVPEALNIGNINPLRYRSYYWDKEFCLYYLQTRYYDPSLGRFISPDSVDYLDPETIIGLNLYAYCGDNPVMCVDPSGHFAISAFLISLAIGFGVGAVIGGGFEIGKQIHSKGWDPNDWDWRQIGLSSLGGGVSGMISAIPYGGWIGAFFLGGAGAVVGGLITGSVDSVETGLLAFTIGALAGIIAKGISNKLLDIKVGKIFNQGNKARSLAVQKLQGHPLNMGAKALKGSLRNAFKQTTKDEISKLIENANPLFNYNIYSTIISNPLSGWF